MGKYEVINPLIVGSFQTKYDASNAIEAGEKFWKSLTQNNKNLITNNVPQFMFTLKADDGALSHFVVKEHYPDPDNKNVDFTIEELTVKIPEKKVSRFNKKLSKERSKTNKLMEQSGGAHKKRYEKKKDDDSSSSSDNDAFLSKYIYFKNVNSPILYWWYYPAIYTDIKHVFIPNFNYAVTPYISIGW